MVMRASYSNHKAMATVKKEGMYYTSIWSEKGMAFHFANTIELDA